MTGNKATRFLVELLLFYAVVDVVFSAGRATSCMTQLRTLDVEDVYQDVVTDERITASSFDPYYPPHEARLSGLGWCAESVCTAAPGRQYLQIDYGSEVVLEAIAIDTNDEGFYVNEYMIEYAGSDGVINCMVDPVTNSTIFRGVDICRQRTDPDVRSFMYPVIAQYVRIIPLSWEGPFPCLTVELYGCPVLECSRTRAVSDNANILPAENIEYSSMALTQGTDSISTGWCATDSSSYFIANFAEPVHLLYAMASGYSIYYLTDFSYFYENRSGEMIPYINVDGERVFGLEGVGEESFLLWESITTRRLHFVVLGSSSGTFDCIEIHFYGCSVHEVVNHVMLPGTTPTPSPSTCHTVFTPSSSPSPSPPQSPVSVVTVTERTTVLVTVAPTIVTRVTPQSTCTEQQSGSSSSSNDSDDVVTICVPVVIVVGIIIVIVLVIVGGVVWWKTRRNSGGAKFDKVMYTPSGITTIVENDLYGLESTIDSNMKMNAPLTKGNEPVDATNQGNAKSKEEAGNEHPQELHPPVTYDSVSLHGEAPRDKQSVPGVANSIYEEIPTDTNTGLPNPSYETQLPRKIDQS